MQWLLRLTLKATYGLEFLLERFYMLRWFDHPIPIRFRGHPRRQRTAPVDRLAGRSGGCNLPQLRLRLAGGVAHDLR